MKYIKEIPVMKRTLTVLIALMALYLMPLAAHAATINVDTFADIVNSGISGDTDGACSLREAVISANNDTAVDTCTAGGGDDTIELMAGEYVLSIAGTGEDASATGDLDILNSVTIEGFGQAIVNADSIDRVFHIMNSPSTPDPSVAFKQLTVTGGSVAAFGGGIYAEGYALLTIDGSIINASEANHGGGLFFSDGTLDISGSLINGNNSTAFIPGNGGGIYLNGGITSIINSTLTDNTSTKGGGCVTAGSDVSIINSTVSGNSASDGGGFYFTSSSTATITDSTINGNSATIDGGGVYVKTSTATITNSTISANSAIKWGGGVNVYSGKADITNSTISKGTAHTGGGVFVDFGTGNITSSTVSGNTATQDGGGLIVSTGTANIANSTISENSAGDTCGGILVTGTGTMTGTILSGNTAANYPDCFSSGTLTSLGYNLVSVISPYCTFASAGDMTDINPLLGPLADNGGPTMTHALHHQSPALDKGHPSCTGTDQRGIERPVDGNADGISRCDIGAFEYKVPLPQISILELDFGRLSYSASIENTVTLSNEITGGYLIIGNVAGIDTLEAPFSIVNDTCSFSAIPPGDTCDIAVRFEPSTYTAAATGIGGLGIVMLAIVLTSGATRRRKAIASLLIGGVMVAGLLTACGTDTETVFVKGDSSGSFSDTFNIPSNDPDTPNITVNVSGSF
jgi:CSLREA domain-containing protein